MSLKSRSGMQRLSFYNNNQLQVSTTNKPEVVQKITPLKPIVITIDRLSD